MGRQRQAAKQKRIQAEDELKQQELEEKQVYNHFLNLIKNIFNFRLIMKQLTKSGSRLKLKKERKNAKLKNKVKLILIRVASIRMTSIKTSETVSLKVSNIFHRLTVQRIFYDRRFSTSKDHNSKSTN